MNIFYCDDDIDDIELFSEVVERIDSNINVITKRDPVEALSILPHLTPKPDFMFFDFAMNKMDGLECAIALKRNKQLKRIPLILLSGGLNKGLIEHLNKIGVYMFLSKTTNPDDFEQSLRAILMGDSDN